jgi:hypothetical protein
MFAFRHIFFGERSIFVGDFMKIHAIRQFALLAIQEPEIMLKRRDKHKYENLFNKNLESILRNEKM